MLVPNEILSTTIGRGLIVATAMDAASRFLAIDIEQVRSRRENDSLVFTAIEATSAYRYFELSAQTQGCRDSSRYKIHKSRVYSRRSIAKMRLLTLLHVSLQPAWANPFVSFLLMCLMTIAHVNS